MDPILYEGPLPMLAGNFRLCKAGTAYYILYYEKLWNGKNDGWERVSLSGERKYIHRHAYIEALKLALEKATNETV